MRLNIIRQRLGQGLVAGIVTTLTFAVVAQAVQTITLPSAALILYDLAPGANSAPITPDSNTPVFVMGVQTVLGNRGVGQVTLPRVPASFLEWVGLESTAAAAITQGFSGVAGTHIVYLDFSHTVDIEVNTTDTFRVHNGNGAAQTGKVKLIW
ncbi:MAG: hypothetical protein HY267_01665 [Deltaproteobacteria bacterium]|nr:hypothetical protein [Deltaproteobacteria bacterium]